MGTCTQLSRSRALKLDDFTPVYIAGKGRYGTVYKVNYKEEKTFLALKEISKVHLAHSQQNEKKILSNLLDPFIANLHSSFNTRTHIYLVLDYLPGVNLKEYLIVKTEIQKEELLFFAACIIRALEYLNKKKVIHHDLKPENLVFDSKGYLILTDFGLSQKLKHLKPNSSGTVPYISPEALYGQSYSCTSDVFALGVILYELMEKTNPFKAESRTELMESYLNCQLEFKSDAYGNDAIDFVSKCLVKNSANRIGANDFSEIKQHRWLEEFNWQELENFRMVSPCKDYIKKDCIKANSFKSVPPYS